MENTTTNAPRMGEDAHTPTPWQFDTEPGFEQDSQTHTQAQIFGPKFNNAAPVVAFVVSRKEATANAAFIVRAVNSHAALVAALEESAGLLRAARLRLGMADAVGILSAWQFDAARVESQARAALAAARNP